MKNRDKTSEDKIRRRKMLKGLMTGLPVIITLKSGAAIAATSLQNSCIADGGGNSIEALNNANNDRCINGIPDNQKAFVHLSDSNHNWDGGNGPGTPNQYCAVYMKSDGSLPTENEHYGATKAYDSNMNRNAAPDINAGYYAVRESCWTSFH